MAQERSPVYKLKRVDFFGRKVPIALQNENGPCPLLAIANILLLKKQIELPEHASDISQNRLVSLVAGHLLDTNDEKKVGKGLPEEYKANLRKNVADAIGILSKLTTGIDVNVRFHDVKGFEFTDEIAIFDLLDISLVHGWLVDPQDAATAASFGQKSYNEVVEQLVMILGDATPKRLLTPQLSRRHSGFSTPRRTSSGLGPVAPSELLSPTEINAVPAQAGSDASLVRVSAPSTSTAVQAASGSAEAASSADQLTAPTGAMTSASSHQPVLSEAAQAGDPTGSLVSVQQLASAPDAHPPLPTHLQQRHLNSAHAGDVQTQTILISPAAELASRAYPLPAAPMEGGGLSTPQSSGKLDAHIATAPTPYPSLASEFSQATNSPVSSKGSALGASFSPSGQGHADATSSSVNTDSKSRFAPADTQQSLEAAADDPALKAETVSSAESDSDAPKVSRTLLSTGIGMLNMADQRAATAASENSSVSYPACSDGISMSDTIQPADDLSIADMKLDTADDEQLQLALAISLGQQEAEQAQEAAQDVSMSQHDDPLSTAELGQTPQADSPGSQQQMSIDSAQGGRSVAVKSVPNSQSDTALPMSSHTTTNQHSAHSSDGEASQTQHGMLEEHPLDLILPHSPAKESSAVAGPDSCKAGQGLQELSTDAETQQKRTHTLDEAASIPEPKATSEPDALSVALGSRTADTAAKNGSGVGGQDSQRAERDVQNQQKPAEKGLGGFQAQQLSEQITSGADSQAAGSRRRTTSDQDERSKAAAQAHIIQDFLDGSSSQLTHHGLASLREGLRPNELAVFFRNNHFNTIFLHKNVVHILVTDQGYEFEKNVVWEKLDDLLGNTQFLKADFTPYGSHSLADQVSDAADLVQAAFAGIAPTKGQASTDNGAVDADFALALQLQEEEERRATRNEQSRQQAQQQQGQRGASQSRQQQPSSRSSQSRNGSQGRPPSGRSSDQGFQSFANPMQRQQQQGSSQQAQQQAEKPTTSSTIAKWFGWGSKK